MILSREQVRAAVFPQSPHGHFSELDGMRGVLAIAVMLFHYGLSTIIGQISLGALPNSNWGLCVDFFFLLSGFVLCHSFIKRPVGPSEFLWRRTLRLVPMYLAATVLSLFFVPDKFSNFDVDTNLLLLQPVFGTQSINFAAWSVPLELYFPLLAVAAAPLIARMTRPFATAAFATVISLGALSCYVYQSDIDLELTRAIAGLSAGALLYHRRLRRLPPKASALVAVCGLGGAIVIMTVSGVVPAASVLFYPCAIAAIWYGAGARGIFSTRPFQAAGRWSYSIYLLHIPVLAIVQFWTGSSLEGALFSKAALVMLVISLAALTYRVVERPAMTFRTWYAPALAATN